LLTQQEKSLATGAVSGVVRDSITRAPLAGVAVFADSTNVSTDTDSTGRYVLTHIPAGSHSISVSYIGYVSIKHKPVLVKPGQTASIDIDMANFEDGAEEMARQDIANGLVRIMLAGLQIGEVPDSAYTDKYGFRYTFNCTVWGFAAKYNAVVEKYLNKRNGPGWQSDLDFEWKLFHGLRRIK